MSLSSLDISTLNKEQLQAVIHDPHIPLQILAGPGSGKTKVLTSRIAYLIEHYGLKPSEICAVTFTNKAANEMKVRLTNLIGKKKSAELTLGTFHSICAKYLHEYGPSIGLSKNFTICDAEASKKIIEKIIKECSLDRELAPKENEIISKISQAKVKGLLPADLMHDKAKQSTAMIYQEYVAALKQNNSLDFDDLLLFGTRLFSKEVKCRNFKHVLVDEFQDTNFIQYKLLVQLASETATITIVGDPDHWRSADTTNLDRMKKDFQNTSQIFLEENFRSTMSILKFSLALISQDKTRISKTLRTSHAYGIPPRLRKFTSESDEAQFVAREIKRLSVSSGGCFHWKDFSVLLRFNALSRNIETALQREGVPYRMLAGVKFFDRSEIKDLTAYLQLIDNPSYFPAFQRACHAPSKGLGEKSLEQLLSKANATNQSVTNLAISIVSGKVPDLKPPLRKKLMPLITSLRKLIIMAEKGQSVASIIQELVSSIGYETHLKKHKDWETRWENVKELINFANQSEKDLESILDTSYSHTPLRKFLHESMLSMHGKDEMHDQTEMVTISTCHSAKGLEWPVVFIPAVEKSIFPFYRSENEKEERRLLYVACTRAQSFLYLTYTSSRMAGERVSGGISPFLSIMDDSLISTYFPATALSEDIFETINVNRSVLCNNGDISFFNGNISTNNNSLAPISSEVSFKTAKNMCEKADNLLTSGKSSTSAVFISQQLDSLEKKRSLNKSGDVAGLAGEKNSIPTETPIPLSKRLGMGRIAVGYHSNKKAKPS